MPIFSPPRLRARIGRSLPRTYERRFVLASSRTRCHRHDTIDSEAPEADRGAPINPICAPQSMSAKKPMAAHSGGSARSRRPPADHLTLRRSPSTGSRLRYPAGRSRRQPSTHMTRTALLGRCSEQEYEAVGTDGCPAAEVRDHRGFGGGPGGGVRESHVADLPVSHEVVQCGDGFFDRSVCWPELCSQYRSMYSVPRRARLPSSCRADDLPTPGSHPPHRAGGPRHLLMPAGWPSTSTSRRPG